MLEPKPSKVLAVGVAAQLWKLYGFNSPKELVLEDLALSLGVLVVEAALEKADARLVRRGDHGLVRVSQTIPETGRRRFAIAHELGHWMLHKSQSQINACTEQNMVAKYKASVPEVEANYFAAELLMPEKLLGPRVKNVRPSFAVFSELANDFDTTLTAMAVRCADVVDGYCALVVSQNNKVHWWRGSEDFEQRFWIEPGSLLSEEALAGSVFRGKPVPSGPVEVDSEAWASCRHGFEHEPLFEEVFLMPSYGQVLSLLYLW